jgi:hypothetical protein
MMVKVLLQCHHCQASKETWENLEERKEAPNDWQNPFSFGTGMFEVYPDVKSLEYEKYGCDDCRQKSLK